MFSLCYTNIYRDTVSSVVYGFKILLNILVVGILHFLLGHITDCSWYISPSRDSAWEKLNNKGRIKNFG